MMSNVIPRAAVAGSSTFPSASFYSPNKIDDKPTRNTPKDIVTNDIR